MEILYFLEIVFVLLLVAKEAVFHFWQGKDVAASCLAKEQAYFALPQRRDPPSLPALCLCLSFGIDSSKCLGIDKLQYALFSYCTPLWLNVTRKETWSILLSLSVPDVFF